MVTADMGISPGRADLAVTPGLGHLADRIDVGNAMNRAAKIALRHHCRLSIETIHPRFSAVDPAGYTVVLTVNSGYE